MYGTLIRGDVTWLLRSRASLSYPYAKAVASHVHYLMVVEVLRRVQLGVQFHTTVVQLGVQSHTTVVPPFVASAAIRNRLHTTFPEVARFFRYTPRWITLACIDPASSYFR